MRDLIFLMMFLFMMVQAARSLHAATMLWAWIALCAPQQYLFGFGVTLPWNKIAVAVTLISIFVDQTKKQPYIDSHIGLVGLFVIQGIISFSVGLSDQSRTYDLLDRMIKIYILCFIMTMAPRERLQIHAMMIILCLGMGIHGGLEGLKYIAAGGSHKVEAPLSIGDNNTLALATLMVMPAMVYIYRYSVSLPIRLLFAGMVLACFTGVVATASRGGLIGLLILGAFLFLQSRRKALTLLGIAVLAGGLVVLAPPQWTERMNTIAAANEDDSFMFRVSSWKLNTILALDRPLVGGGYSALEDSRVFAAYRQEFHMLDFIYSPEPTGVLAAHSTYFETLGDLGFPGLLLFLAILFTGFRNLALIRRCARGNPSLAWADDLAVMFRVTLVIYMVSGAALSVAYFELLYIMLTQISVLRRHLEESAALRPRVPDRRPALRHAAT